MSKTKAPPCLICVSVAARTVQAALVIAQAAAAAADVIEIRLDALDLPEVAPFFQGLSSPLLFTNRRAQEGGFFKGTEEERIAPLLAAIRAGAAYVDVELAADPIQRQQVIREAGKHEARVIVSWHNFDRTPPAEELHDVVMRQLESGAALGKVVTMAHTPGDVLRVLDLQWLAAELDFPLVAFCMGGVGMISRLATMGLGGYMTYAAPDTGPAAAPGQLPVSELRRLADRFSLHG